MKKDGMYKFKPSKVFVESIELALPSTCLSKLNQINKYES